MRKKLGFPGVLLSIVLLVFFLKEVTTTPRYTPKSGDGFADRMITVWTVYWDSENIDQEFERLNDTIENVCYFAAYFEEENKPFIPEKTTATFEKIRKTDQGHRYGSYLTFVNDVKKADGSSELKSKKLLHTFLASEETMDRHINEILALTKKGGYDGIEIDYEAIKEDKELWKQFIRFVEKLYQSASAQNLRVRVLLEPNAPVENFAFHKGPEYVVMCYNLNGYGTKPGPKANREFLFKMIKKAEYLPGKVNFALATGGFDFTEDGSVTQITERQAEQLKEKYKASPKRDKESQSLVLTYKDPLGMTHEVWYADKSTMDYWCSIIEDSGDYGLSLWRI